MVRRYLAGEPQSYLNRMFPSLWAELDLKNVVPSFKDALSRKNYPSDRKLRRALELRKLYDKSEPNRRRTGFVLAAVNRKLSEGTGGFTVLDGAATIEHIMPQRIGDDWKNDLGIMWEQVHRDYLHTLGNLTLVTAGWNSELSNSSFQNKQIKLSSNALRLNTSYFSQELARWGREEIRERCEKLSDTITAIWPSFLPADQEGQAAVDLSKAAEFDYEAVERVAEHLGSPLRRLSQARYESTDGRQRLVGLCSKSYPRGAAGHRYWYGIKPSQREFLERAHQGWLAFECEKASRLVLLPFEKVQPLFRSLSETEGMHWHVELFHEGGRIELPLPLGSGPLDVTEYYL